MAFLMAAAVAFLGSAMLLKAGRAFPDLAGASRATGEPGILLLVIVILFGAAGAILLAMAGNELLALRRRSHAR